MEHTSITLCLARLRSYHAIACSSCTVGEMPSLIDRHYYDKFQVMTDLRGEL